MSKTATREYTVKMRQRYKAMKTKGAKGRALDEFCETTELERKYAIKVLRSQVEPLRPAGRKATYTNAVAEVLKRIERSTPRHPGTGISRERYYSATFSCWLQK